MAQRERKDEQPARPIPTAGTDHEVDDLSRGEATADQGDRTDLLRRVALAEAEQAKGQAREAALAARLIDAESDLASLVALEAEASEQRRRAEKEGARAERAERVLRDVTSSVSWRLTRPLRAGRSVFSARDR
jgi:hypothetical protein